MSINVFTTRNTQRKNMIEQNLEIVISAALEDSAREISDRLKQDMEDAAKVGVNMLKTIPPYRRGSGRGHYRSGWRQVVEESDWHYSAVVYQYNKPTLTYLLENGHNLMRWNRGHTEKRKVGYVDGIPHISRAKDAVLEHLKSKGW